MGASSTSTPKKNQIYIQRDSEIKPKTYFMHIYTKSKGTKFMNSHTTINIHSTHTCMTHTILLNYHLSQNLKLL